MTPAISQTTAPTSGASAPSMASVRDANANANDAASSQDRFLKLLVAQLNNQDPMNPMDNAQMTSQIAQINTVTGIQQLNETVKGLVGQFASQQLMQGSAMVGRQVLVEGDALVVNPETHIGHGALDLSGSASSVKVQVLGASGQDLGTLDLGPLQAGRYNFEWDGSAHPDSGPVRFKVLATQGEAAVAATPLTIDQVAAVSLDNGALQLQLARGDTLAYSAIKSIL